MLQPGTVAANSENTAEIKKIAIIPFKINSQKELAYIRDGIGEMIASRIAWKNHIAITSPIKIKVLLKSLDKGTSDYPDKKLLSQIASDSHSDYIIYGSITEFTNAFSLDTTVFNSKKQTSQAFFTQADTLDQIISKVEIMAAQINIEIFNRKTSVLEQRKKNEHQNSQNLIRANPEDLIKENRLERKEDHRPFWKFWENDNNQEILDDQLMKKEENNILINREDAEEKKEKKPFWKIW